MGLALAVAGTTTDNLNDFCQRGTDAYGDTMLAPLPVKALFGSAESNQNVERITAVHAL